MKAKVKTKGEGEDRKPRMTAEQKQLLEASKSFDADVERSKYICHLSLAVRREMCKTCENDGCKQTGPNPKCILSSIAAVAVGMILDELKGGAR